MNCILMIGLAPFSWKIGIVRSKPGKMVLGLGPLRFAYHFIGDR